MQTTISARHCDLTDSLRERAEAVTARLEKIAPHALEATIVFETEAHAQAEQTHKAEIRLHARGRKVLIAVAEGPDHRTALDRAEEKLRPQLEKATRPRQRSQRASPQDS